MWVTWAWISPQAYNQNQCKYPHSLLLLFSKLRSWLPKGFQIGWLEQRWGTQQRARPCFPSLPQNQGNLRHLSVPFAWLSRAPCGTGIPYQHLSVNMSSFSLLCRWGKPTLRTANLLGLQAMKSWSRLPNGILPMETELQPYLLADAPDLDLLFPDLTWRLQITRSQHVSKEANTLLLGIALA